MSEDASPPPPPSPPPHERNVEANNDNGSALDQSDLDESTDSTTDSSIYYETADSMDMDDTPVQNDALITFKYHRYMVLYCSLHPERELAATSSYDNHVYVWNTQTGQISFNMKNKSLSLVAFNYDGRYLAVGTSFGKLLIYSINECAEISEMFQKVVDKSTYDIHWMNWYRSKYAIVTGGSNHICIWSVPSGTRKLLVKYSYINIPFANGILSRDDRKLYVSIERFHLQLWDLTTDTVLMEVDENHPMIHKAGICALACDTDSNLYVSADFNGMILFCRNDGPFKSIEIPSRTTYLALSPLNELKLLAIANARGVINMWDYTQHKTRSMTALNDGIAAITWISERVMAIATKRGDIYGIDALTFALKFKLSGHLKVVTRIDYNTRSRMALTVSDDETARIFRFPQLNE